MYLKGITQADIAGKYKVTQQTISNDLKALRKQWRDSAIRDFDEAQAEELRKIDELEKVYWEAWAKSVKDYQKTVKKEASGTSVKGKFENEEKKVERIKLLGNPRYLDGVLSCIQKRCEILGLDAPVKTETTLNFKDIDWFES